MAENEQTTAADLDKAAAEAVASQQEIEQDVHEDAQIAQETAEDTTEIAEAAQAAEDAEGLPTDHKERSDLGRKVSAFHRRIDEIDNKFDRLMTYLESSKQKNEQEDLDPDAPLTRRELEQWEKERDRIKTQQQQQYQSAYKRAIGGMGSDLSDDQWNAVLAEMQHFTYDPTTNPELDARLNFEKAEKLYWKKQAASRIERKNPLKGEKPAEKIGVATAQKTVVKEPAMPKLDAHAQSFLDFVSRESGEEAARKLVKDLDG